VRTLLESSLPPNTPIYYTLGNHDTSPVNGFSIQGDTWAYNDFDQVDSKYIPTRKMYAFLASEFGKVLPEGPTRATFNSTGNYATRPWDGFKLISLSELFLCPWNFTNNALVIYCRYQFLSKR
jgi:3',5'-cyclic AMP phosphodiesterase CpdA